jgi:hypothetical protein
MFRPFRQLWFGFIQYQLTPRSRILVSVKECPEFYGIRGFLFMLHKSLPVVYTLRPKLLQSTPSQTLFLKSNFDTNFRRKLHVFQVFFSFASFCFISTIPSGLPPQTRNPKSKSSVEMEVSLFARHVQWISR